MRLAVLAGLFAALAPASAEEGDAAHSADPKAVRQEIAALAAAAERLDRARKDLEEREKELKEARRKKEDLERELHRIQEWAKKAGPGAQGYESWMSRLDEVTAKNPPQIRALEAEIPGLERRVEAAKRAVAQREVPLQERVGALRGPGKGILPEVGAYLSTHKDDAAVPHLKRLWSELSAEPPPSPDAKAPAPPEKEAPPDGEKEPERQKEPPAPPDPVAAIRKLDACAHAADVIRSRQEKAERNLDRACAEAGQARRKAGEAMQRKVRADADRWTKESNRLEHEEVPAARQRLLEAKAKTAEAEGAVAAALEDLRASGEAALPAIEETLGRKRCRADTAALLEKLKAELSLECRVLE